jgi:hydrogenase expression/formation protein HypC
MCLEVPVQVERVNGDGTARCRSGGRTVEVSLLTLPDPGKAGASADPGVRPGDWLIVHAGFALHRIGADEARAALRMREATP